jgi:uncharacterized protein (TIGR00730 family)
MSSIRSVCVYCGSSEGRLPLYVEAGYAFGKVLASHGLRLVFGGGTRGIMGAVARGVHEAGGLITGIIPQFLIRKEASEAELVIMDELIVTENMHERKHAMFERSDAFVAFPGGIGTVEEIVEIMTWAQLGRHNKPMVFANTGGFWDPMMVMLDHMREAGFIHTGHRVRPLVTDRVEDILPAILDRAAATDDKPSEGNRTVIDKL